jgi:hypothetical protein
MAFTIKLLEVRLEIEGDAGEREFTRLFNENIIRWQRRMNEERALQVLSEYERSLGDQEGGGR